MTRLSSTQKLDGLEFIVEFWPRVIIQRWIVTRVLIQRCIVTPVHDSTLNFDPEWWFHVDLWHRIIILRWIVILGHDLTLKCNPGSWFHAEHSELWARVIIPCWIMTPGLNSTLNCNLESWFNYKFEPGSKFSVVYWPESHFNVEFWHGVGIQRWILTHLHIFYTWTCDSRWYRNSTAWWKFDS